MTISRHSLTIICLIAALLISGCRSRDPGPVDGKLIETEIGEILNNAVLGPGGGINRHVLLYIDAPTVNFTYKGAAGIARVDTGENMTADRQFMVASVAKAMTAVVIHQLAEEGAFGAAGIEATLAGLEVLPPEVMTDLHLMNGISYADQITLRHLLTHTSGLRDLYFDGVDNPVTLMPGTAEGAAPDSLVGMAAFDEELGLTPLARCTMEGIPAGCNPDEYLFRHKWPNWDYAAWQANPDDRMAGLLNFYLAGMNDHALCRPGECFHYGDTNYLLLEMVIEKVTGNSMDHELRSRIFDPLGMDDTYLIGEEDPDADIHLSHLADVWAWDEPSISGGVDFSFDVGAIVSTLDDMNKFARGLVAGDLFQNSDTLNQYLAVPGGIEGISYASGLIVFPTSKGPVLYMMGSNGTWVEYYPPLDLVMIGTTDDFSNMPGQFMLHASIHQVLASHGLSTPMAKMSGLPMSLIMLCSMLLFVLYAIWLILVLRGRKTGGPALHSIKHGRWLGLGAFLLNLALMILIGMTFAENPFQMLFGFSPQIRALFLLTGFLLAVFALAMGFKAVQCWRQKAGTKPERLMLVAVTLVTLIYAASTGLLGL